VAGPTGVRVTRNHARSAATTTAAVPAIRSHPGQVRPGVVVLEARRTASGGEGRRPEDEPPGETAGPCVGRRVRENEGHQQPARLDGVEVGLEDIGRSVDVPEEVVRARRRSRAEEERVEGHLEYQVGEFRDRREERRNGDSHATEYRQPARPGGGGGEVVARPPLQEPARLPSSGRLVEFLAREDVAELELPRSHPCRGILAALPCNSLGRHRPAGGGRDHPDPSAGGAETAPRSRSTAVGSSGDGSLTGSAPATVTSSTVRRSRT
jgi:hypothetical protein